MRRCRAASLRWGLVAAAACLAAVAGCSHSGGHRTATTSPAQSSSHAGSLPPGAVGISPAGVTTRVDVPADSTEEEYFQACHAARVWMDAQPDTGQPLVEPYLTMVQGSASGVAGSWNTRWADLTPARQSAVIVAAAAAADHGCG